MAKATRGGPAITLPIRSRGPASCLAPSVTSFGRMADEVQVTLVTMAFQASNPEDLMAVLA